MKKKILLAVALVVVVAAAVSAVVWGPFFKKGGDNVNSTSAKVDESKQFGFETLKINGAYVNTALFNEQYNAFYEKYKNNAEMLQKTDEERNDMFLDQLIEKVVMDDYFANKSNVKVSDEEVNAYVAKYVAPRYSGSEEQTTYFQSMGFANEEDMKNTIKDYLLKQQVYYAAATKAGLTLTDKERKDAYEEHKSYNKKVDLRNILVAINDKRTKEQAQELANTVYTKLKNGESFEALAKQYSDDSESKENGGQKKMFYQAIMKPTMIMLSLKPKLVNCLNLFIWLKGMKLLKLKK